MTTVNDLPNEIVLELWHYILPPEDIARFALVSKRIFDLATIIDRALLLETATFHL